MPSILHFPFSIFHSKRALLFLFSIFHFQFCIAQAQSWLSALNDPQLETLLAQANTTNQVKAGEATQRAAEYRVEANRAYYLPNLFLNPLVQQQSLAPNRPLPIAAQGTRFTLRSFALPFDLAYDLNFWLKDNLTAQARNQVRQAAIQLSQTRLSLSLDVARVLYAVRTADLRIAIIQRNLRLLDSVNTILDARYKAGLTNQVSILLNQTERQALKITESSIRQERDMQQARLIDLLNQPATLPAAPAPLPQPLPTDTTINDQITSGRPDIQLSNLNVESANLLTEQLSFNRRPRPFVLASTGFISQQPERIVQRNSFTYTIGAGVSIPIWDWRNNRHHVQAARADARAREFDLSQLRFTAQSQVAQSLAALRQTRTQIQQNAQALTSARQAVRLTSELYTKGLINFLDLLNAERNIIVLEQQQIQLQGQYLQSWLDYVEARGGVI